MRKIYKYKLEPSGVQYRMQVDMPYSAGILSLKSKDGVITVYAEVEADDYDFTQYFYVLLTGEEVPEDCEFLSTLEISNDWGNYTDTVHIYKVL